MTDSIAATAHRRAWFAPALLGVPMIALFLALPLASVTQSAVYDLVGLAMVAFTLIGIRLHRPAGWLPWLVLAAGQLAFVVGDIVWTVFDTQGIDPFPSVADVAYLAGYPLLAAGLAIAIRRRVAGGDRAGLLDGAILAAGATVVWWASVLGPVAAASDPDPITFAISVAYPIGDLLLLGLALGLVMTPGARSAAFRLLVANLVVLLVGDLAFGLQSLDGTYVDGGWLDSLWLFAYVAFAMAAMHPTMAELFDPKPVPVALVGPVRLGLLGAAMLVGPVVLFLARSDGTGLIVVVAAATAIVSVLVLVRLAGIVGHLGRDIARRAELEAQLSFQAFHDPLTGMANRRRFVEALGASLAGGSGNAVLFLDLDDFKDVNDSMGHDAGDALLSGIGSRLIAAVRPGDLACRLGGDEFAVLLPATPSEAEAVAVGERLLVALSAPVTIEGRELRASASLGVALAPANSDFEVDEILRRADVAMYQAKARGKHRLAVFTTELDVGGDASAPSHVRTPGRTVPPTPAFPQAIP